MACAISMAGGYLSEARGQYLLLRDMCRVKGQEENTLHGFGLVVGLKGTGDGDTPTIRALAKTLELMGSPISRGVSGEIELDELKNAKNVAMVFVTATVPAEGARQGDRLTCAVNAISAQSLEGGYLMLTPMLGPRPGDPRLYAHCQGPLALDSSGTVTTAKIHDGCRLEESFYSSFVKDGKITLVLDKSHASFRTAFEIEDLLNTPGSGFGGGQASDRNGYSSRAPYGDVRGEEPIARALDQVNIEITIPRHYRDIPVEFVAEVLDTKIVPPRPEARVVIDERNGNIVIGENVMVGRVAVTHRNVSVETGGPLFELDQASDTSNTRLKALVNALNALKVSPDDIIDIIKSLERSGDLYGRLIIQ